MYLLEVLSSIYCGTDKKCNHMLSEKWALLLLIQRILFVLMYEAEQEVVGYSCSACNKTTERHNKTTEEQYSYPHNMVFNTVLLGNIKHRDSLQQNGNNERNNRCVHGFSTTTQHSRTRSDIPDIPSGALVQNQLDVVLKYQISLTSAN
jgi:hypothetical protein